MIRNNNLHPGADSGSVASVSGTTYSCALWGGYSTGNKCAAPSFVNVAGGKITWNLHLAPGDTADINFGSGGASADIDGQTRSGTPDIGADEFLSSDTTKPKPPTNLQIQ